MKLKNLWPFFVLLVICVGFFYQTIFQFKVPFPGDLLISEYAPWKYESYLGYNPGSYPNKAQYFDVIRQLYPWKMLVVDELKMGKIPLWNPYNFSGSPLLANHQSAVLNPFNTFFFFLSPPAAWSFFILVQPLLASLFMFLFLRQIKLTQEASLLGSISYGYSLFISTFLEYGNFGHTIMWLPLVLFLIEKYIAEKKRINLYPIPVIVALIIFSGHLQLAFGSLVFVFLYILFQTRKRVILLFSIALGLGFSAVQLVPTIELIGYSARVPHELGIVTKNFLLQFYQLILFISPDTYGNPATRNYLLDDTYPGNAFSIGVVPLLFAIYGATKFRKNSRITYFVILSIVLLVFLTNNPISELFYSLNIPLLSTSAPSNFLYLLSFSLSVLGAVGLTFWQKKKEWKILSIPLGIFLLSLILIGFHEFLRIPYLLKLGLLGCGVILFFGIGIVISKFLKNKIIVYIFLLMTCFELFYYFQKFNPFVLSKLIYPLTPIETFLKEKVGSSRYWGVGAANLEANFSTQMKVYSPEGYDPLYPKRYGEYISGRQTDFSIRSDAKITSTEGKGLLSIKYVLDRVENGSTEKTLPPDSFKLVESFDGWRIFENIKALPRAFSVTSDCLFPMSVEKCNSEGTLSVGKILAYSPTEIKIKTGSRSGMLILTDTYYPGWQATSRGKRLDIIEYSKTFRGIENLDANQEVLLQYIPNSFKWGVIITIISIVTGFALLRFYRYEK